MDTPDFLAEGANINPQTPNPTPNPENAPQTPSGKGKKILATIATLAVVLTASVYYFGFSGAQADDNPPTLESSDSAGYQGFIRADKKKFGFSQFEKKDVEAFKTKEKKHKADKLTPLTLKMTAANKGTYYLYWNGDIKNKRTNEISFAEILENVEAKEDGVIFVAKYDAGKKRFISTPHKYFKEEVNNVKVLESKSIADMGQVTVRPGEVFILMASMPEFKVYGLGDGTKKYKGDTPKLADLPKGWNLLVANTDNLRGMLEKQAQYIDRIYPQEDLSLEPFKKGYDNDELPSKIKHHVFWVKTQEADKKKVDHKKESVTAPTNLKAYYELDNKTHLVNVTWEASPKAVDGYEIELYRNKKLIHTTKMKGHSSGTYGLEITEPGAYQFKMTSYKGKEKSKTVASNKVDIEVLKKADTDKNKVETPKNLKLVASNDNKQLTLTWDIPKEEADSYELTITKDGTDLDSATIKYTELKQSKVMVFELKQDNPIEAGKYSMKVQANLGAKKSSTVESKPVTIKEVAKVDEKPTKVENLKAKVDGTKITLTWDAATDDKKVTSYEVFYDTKSHKGDLNKYNFSLDSEGKTTATIENLNPGEYYFVVTSNDADGNYATSVEVSATVADKKDEKPKEETKVDEDASKATKDGAEVKVSEKKSEEGKSKVTCKDEDGKEVACKFTFDSINKVYVIGGLSAGNYTYTFTNSLGTASYSNSVAQVSMTKVKLYNNTKGFPDYVSPGMKEQLVASVDVLATAETQLTKLETVLDSANKLTSIKNIQAYLDGQKLEISRVQVTGNTTLYNVISGNNKINKGKNHVIKIYADITNDIPVSTATEKKFLRMGIGKNTSFLNTQYNDTHFSGLSSPYTPVYKNSLDYYTLKQGYNIAPNSLGLNVYEDQQEVFWDPPEVPDSLSLTGYELEFKIQDQQDSTVNAKVSKDAYSHTFTVNGYPVGTIEVTAVYNDGTKATGTINVTASDLKNEVEVKLHDSSPANGTKLTEGESNLLAMFELSTSMDKEFKITSAEFTINDPYGLGYFQEVIVGHSVLFGFGKIDSEKLFDDINTGWDTIKVDAASNLTISKEKPNALILSGSTYSNINNLTFGDTYDIYFTLKSLTYESNGKQYKRSYNINGSKFPKP